MSDTTPGFEPEDGHACSIHELEAELTRIESKLIPHAENAERIARMCYWLVKPHPVDLETGKPLHEVFTWLIKNESELLGELLGKRTDRGTAG